MGFLTPDAMAQEYLYDEAKRYAEYQFLENEMTRYKTEAVKRFYILVDPIYAESFATTIAFGYDNQLKEAEAIVDKLDLCRKHIASLLEDQEMMSELIFQEKVEDRMEEQAYEYDTSAY